jgi:hypothetical protein
VTTWQRQVENRRNFLKLAGLSAACLAVSGCASLEGIASNPQNPKPNVLMMDVTVPVNTTATIYMPGKNITEGSLPAAGADGVTFVRMEKNKAVFKVESGEYEFKSVVK